MATSAQEGNADVATATARTHPATPRILTRLHPVPVDQLRRGRFLRLALSRAGFRRLLAVRLSGQFADGVFQASLAGAVLFNPERQAHASDIAASFAVLLVPYSLVGPFAGVLLDRWWRQRVLTVTNAVRAGVVALVAAELFVNGSGAVYYATALVAISLSRFVLAALSAGLPHVVPEAELVTANAVTSTAGSIVTALGGATAVGVRALIGTTNAQYAVIALLAAAIMLLSGAAALRFAREVLGPDDAQRQRRETLAEIARGLVAGAAHIRDIPAVARGLGVVGLHRLGYGLTLVCTLLLYRNWFEADGPFRAGVGGLTQVLAAMAVGGGLAAVTTPGAFRRLGARIWVSALLLACAVLQAALVLPYRLPLMLLAALLLGFVSQGIKISVDTLVQRHVEDVFRGRVFSLYDAMVNLALVAAAVITAALLPETGHAPACVLVTSAAYLAMAGWYAVVSSPVRPARPTTG